MRGNVTPLTSGYRPLKRCILIFLAIALLPLLVVYFLIDDQMRHIGPMHVSSTSSLCDMFTTPTPKLRTHIITRLLFIVG